MTPALVVFAKVPAAGAVKTRLVPPLAPEEAAALYDAFLRDALEAWAAPGAFGPDLAPAVRLYLAPESLPRTGSGDGDAPPDLAPEGVSVHVQRGDGLGARMLRAAVETFAAGHDRVVVVGTDHPTLPSAFIGEAFRALAEPFAVVLGPSDDGGYYLLGLNEVLPALFDGMTYSHAGVFRETLARAAGVGRPVVLPPWYDVDTPDALARLAAEVRDGAAVGPRTAAALTALAPRIDATGGP